MSLDSITETIAHFVGTFELTIEQGRLRDQYEEFTALRRKVELEDLSDPTRIEVKATLKADPGNYAPIPFKFNTPPAELPPPPPANGPNYETNIFLYPPEGPSEAVREAALGPSEAPPLMLFQFQNELIGSAVTYTFQTLFLRDNDVVGEGEFRDVDALISAGQDMLEAALTFHAVAAPSFALADYASLELLSEIAEQIVNPMNSDIEGVTVHQFHGEDAVGVIINGEKVEEAPEWDDLLPAYHQPDEETETPDVLPVEWDRSDDEDFADGHMVIAGGNLAVNEVAATIAWIDAPYIAVGGKAMDLTVISQVAVISDWDHIEQGGSSGTKVVQSASFGVEAKAAYWLNQAEGAEGQPAFASVDWISGDLVVANFIKQEIDATDIDHIQAEISASTTLYAMGDNQMVNVTEIVQLGSYYDVIMIGGNMISVDMLFQTNVLVDDDIVSGGSISAQGDENLVMNEASVSKTGEDSHKVLHQDMANAMALGESDMDALEDALLNDPMFAGMEQIRALKIEGDLMQVNIMEQVTMLLDQDDVHVSGPKAAETEIIAGSNALLNAANVAKAGIDSVVMAAEETYSDLLLHQASLYDVPDQDDISELTNDAIAVLMEEANSELAKIHETVAKQTAPTEMAGADDGLQTMLA
jgi:hypothetical protein